MYIIPPPNEVAWSRDAKIPNKYPYAYGLDKSKFLQLYHYKDYLRSYKLKDLFFIHVDLNDYVKNFNIYGLKKFRLLIHKSEYEKGMNHFMIDKYYIMTNNNLPLQFVPYNNMFYITVLNYVIYKRKDSIIFLESRGQYQASQVGSWQ